MDAHPQGVPRDDTIHLLPSAEPAPRHGRHPVAVILAAGASTRLGCRKQFLRWRGATLLARCIACARRATGRRPWVITGSHRFAIALAAARAGAAGAYNPRWRSGMGSSLARAGRLLRRERALLVLTVDQYRLREMDLRRLLRAWRRRPTRAAAAWYAGRAGVPAVLPARWQTRLGGLRADRGAREWLNARGAVTTRIPMPDAAFDIDTAEDWRGARMTHRRG